ncbi:hypothetical protein LTR50_002077 [Elasticomyces elasticus]|nr:hypothetical protein LTR50_002077 [Elasticomyces elasticus]
MHLLALSLALAASTTAQKIDFASIASSHPYTVPFFATGVTTQHISYNPTKAASSVKSYFTAHPWSQWPSSTGLRKRSTCDPQPTGAGPVPTPDTAEAFVAYAPFVKIASSAATPFGYQKTFTALNASNFAYSYLGFTYISSYDPNICSTKCNAMNGCASFNIYYERGPTVEPGTACPNPASTTTIKCAFWGGPVSAANALNDGQWREDFHVVIAGSNGYVRQNGLTCGGQSPKGYSPLAALGNATTVSPLDCNGVESYMGYQAFSDGPFDANLCATVCTAASAYNAAQPVSSGKPQLCKFFTAYILNVNGVGVSQICALYSEYWNSSYSTNFGQWRGEDRYTIDYSFSAYNLTDSGATCPGQAPKAAAAAAAGPAAGLYGSFSSYYGSYPSMPAAGWAAGSWSSSCTSTTKPTGM